MVVLSFRPCQALCTRLQCLELADPFIPNAKGTGRTGDVDPSIDRHHRPCTWFNVPLRPSTFNLSRCIRVFVVYNDGRKEIDLALSSKRTSHSQSSKPLQSLPGSMRALNWHPDIGVEGKSSVSGLRDSCSESPAGPAHCTVAHVEFFAPSFPAGTSRACAS